MIASTDLSHQVPQAVAERNDRLALDAIVAGDDAGLLRTVVQNRITMCGPTGVAIALAYARAKGAADRRAAALLHLRRYPWRDGGRRRLRLPTDLFAGLVRPSFVPFAFLTSDLPLGVDAMTWFDVVAVLLFVLIAWVESVRGFGRALFDFLGALIIFPLAPVLAHLLTTSVGLFGAGGAGEATWLALLVIVLGVGALLLTRLVYGATQLSLDYLDPFLGGLLGVALGLMVVFFFLRTFQLSYGDTDAGQAFMQTFAAQEILELRSFHAVVNGLQNLGKV